MDPLEILQWILLGLLLPWIGWVAHILTKNRSMLSRVTDSSETLRRWLEPNAQGRQVWKNPDLAEALDELINEIRGLRGDFRDVIPKLQEEHRAQDKDVAALQAHVTEIKTLLRSQKE